LNAHSIIAIPEEGTFWMPILRLHSSHPDRAIPRKKLQRYFEYIRKNAQFRLWGMDPELLIRRIEGSSEPISLHDLMSIFYGEYAVYEGKKIWGEKSSVFFRKISAISNIFPQAKFIHIVRDGRDVHLSWRKLVSNRGNICVAALEWNHKVWKIEKAFSQLPEDRRLTIRYEDLVSSPDAAIPKICRFLGVDFEEVMLSFWKQSNRYIGSHHSELIFQPITTASIGKWEKKLDPFEMKAYEYLAAKSLSRHQYKLLYPEKQFGAWDTSRIWLFLMIGLPRRMLQVCSVAIRLWIAAKLGMPTKAAGSGDVPSAKTG